MVRVDYEYEIPYAYEANGSAAPRLILTMRVGENSVDLEAYLDSGASESLFNGRFGKALGIDIETGDLRSYSTTTGDSVQASRHSVQLEHQNFGILDLEVGFAIDREITRNLLGRDFFNLMQIGFRERTQLIY